MNRYYPFLTHLPLWRANIGLDENMKLICELNERDLGIGEAEHYDKPYRLRKAARAVLFNEKKEIAYQAVRKFGCFKLPGGGIDAGETVEEGLRREIREEVGCEIKIERPIGIVIEYRNIFDVIQISYNYLATVDGPLGEPTLEQDELDEGMEPLWAPFEKVYHDIKTSKLTVDKARFIVAREVAILYAAREYFL